MHSWAGGGCRWGMYLVVLLLVVMIDAELEDWVEEQNVQKGISPAPGVMISRANEIKHNLVC